MNHTQSPRHTARPGAKTWTAIIEVDHDDEQSTFMRLGLLTWWLQFYGMRLVRYTEGDTCRE
jgi:hypothetical protein